MDCDVTFSANNNLQQREREWMRVAEIKRNMLYGFGNNSKQWVLQSSIARQQMLFINHELASKQYAFAIAVVAVCFTLFRSSNVFGLLIWAHKTNTISTIYVGAKHWHSKLLFVLTKPSTTGVCCKKTKW